MRVRRRLFVAGAAIAVLSAGGAGIAYAVGGSDEQVTGSAAKRAASAALRAAGGGTVLEIERQDGDGRGVFEVEVRRADGSQVEIHLDGRYQPVGTVADDDTGSESDSEDTDAG